MRETGLHFRSALSTLADLDIIHDIRGRGFIMAVKGDPDRKQSFDPSIGVARRVAATACECGLTVRASGGGRRPVAVPCGVAGTDRLAGRDIEIVQCRY